MDELSRLLEINDRLIAEDIQRILEESQIYVLLVSDNPASSVLNIYTGIDPVENISIQINSKDLEKALGILKESQYKDLIETR
jgi:transcription antitermination factor NusA-like protein